MKLFWWEIVPKILNFFIRETELWVGNFWMIPSQNILSTCETIKFKSKKHFSFFSSEFSPKKIIKENFNLELYGILNVCAVFRTHVGTFRSKKVGFLWQKCFIHIKLKYYSHDIQTSSQCQRVHWTCNYDFDERIPITQKSVFS